MMMKGKTAALKFTRTGNEHIAAQFASGRGAVLLGGHLGSFEAMRNGGDEDQVKINILGHFENAKMINELLSRLDPERAATVIHIGDDPVGQMARVHDRVEAGDFVALPEAKAHAMLDLNLGSTVSLCRQYGADFAARGAKKSQRRRSG